MGLENLHLLGPDERRVVGRIVDRLLLGQKVYGDMDLAFDKRNFREEDDWTRSVCTEVYVQLHTSDPGPHGIQHAVGQA